VSKVILLASAAIALALALAVIAGWHFQMPRLIQVIPASVPMQYNTALGFLLAGTGLVSIHQHWQRVRLVAGAGLLLIGGLTIVEYIAGLDIGIDQLFMSHYISVETSHPGRMAPNTAASFFLVGLAFLLLDTLARRRHGHAVLFAIGPLVGVFALVALIGYATGIEAGYGWGQLTRMAVHTSVGFLVVGFGLTSYMWRIGSDDPAMRLIWHPIFAFLFTAILSVSVWQALMAQELQIIRQALGERTERLVTFLGADIGRQLPALERMSGRWVERAGTPKPAWEADAAAHVSDLPGLQAVQWVDESFIVRWIVPLEGNEASESVNLGLDMRLNVALLKSRDEKISVISPPMDLPQRRLGFMTLHPIHIGERFQGFVVGVFDLHSWLENELGKTDFLDLANVSISLEGSVVFSSGIPVTAENAEYSSETGILGEVLTISVSPSVRLVEGVTTVIPALILLFGLLVAALFGWLVRTRSMFSLANVDLERRVVERTTDLEAANKSLRFTQYAVDRADVAAFWIRPEDRGLDFVNENACKMLGYSKDELLALKMFEIDPEAKDEGWEEWMVRLRSEEQAVFESTAVTKSGKVIPTEMNCFATELDGVEHIVAFMRDITERKKVEQKLRSGQEFLQSLLDTSPVPIYITSKSEGRFLMANPAAAELNRLTQAELLERSSKERYFDQKDRQRLVRQLEETGRIDGVDLRVRRIGTGEECWLSFNARAIDYEGEEAFLSVTQDITERKKSELENERLRRALEVAGIGTWAVDLVAETAEWDDNSLAIFGLTREQFSGDLIAWENALHPDDKEKTLKRREELSAKGAEAYDVEYRIIRPSGEVRNVHAEGSFERGDKGDLLYHYGIHHDITERKEAEKELFKASERQRLIMDNSPLGTIIESKDRRIQYANPAMLEMFGYSEDQVVGRKGREFMANPDDYKEINQLSDSGELIPDRLTEMKHKDGSAKWCLMSIIPMEGHGESVTLTTFYDVTERRKTEEELRLSNIELASKSDELSALADKLAAARVAAEDANAAKSTFLTTMSHEIRTPLNGMIGLVDLIRESPLSTNQAEMVGTVQKSAYALLEIVDDILDFSKIEAGNLELAPSECAIVDVVEGVGRALAGSADAKDIKLNVFVDPNLPSLVTADAHRIRQVLMNLVENGIKFSKTTDDAQGYVELGAELVEGGKDGEEIKVRYYVRDNGIGIPEDLQGDLFQPFHQLEGSTTRRHGGSGLGLAICASIVILMDGEIEVESVDGEGSTFAVNLLHPLAVKPGAKVDSEALKDLHGLLVAPDRQVWRILQVYLDHFGCELEHLEEVDFTAATVAKAAKRGEPFDFVFFATPDLAKVARRLVRESEGNDHLQGMRFVVVESKSSAIQADGVDNCITIHGQPLRRDELVRAVAVATGRRSPIVESRERAKELLAPAAAPPTRDEAIAANQLILVAEDNPTNQYVIKQQLTRLGYTADYVEDGMEGVEAMSAGDYGLILTDLHMPNMDGFDLAKAVREKEKGGSEHVPIIAITASAVQAEHDRCLASGMDAFLVKPVELAQLASVVELWLPKPRDKPPPADEIEAEDTGEEGPLKAKQPAETPIDLAHLESILGISHADDVRDVLATFVDSVKDTKETLTSAFEAQDAPAIVAAAHSAKGASRYVGALDLGDSLEQLESAAKDKNWKSSSDLLNTVLSELARVEAYVRD
jgi:PAS domain S-box-containing protein